MIRDGNPWQAVKDGDPRAAALYARHYSARKSRTRDDLRFAGPGRKLVLLTPECDALFVWRDFIPADGNAGLNCAVFRNESPALSSWLILMAERLAEAVFGVMRLYTYVDPRRIRSVNPGCCFLMAGWRRSGVTGRGLLVLDKHGAEAERLGVGLHPVYGRQLALSQCRPGAI